MINTLQIMVRIGILSFLELGKYIDKLNRILGTTIEHHIVFENILDPRSIESKTGSYKGSLYGSASNKRKAAFLDIQTFLKIFKVYIFVVVAFILEAGFHWHYHRLKL